MRTRLFTAAIVAAIFLALPAVTSAECHNLKCAVPGAEGQMLGGPGSLEKQKVHGFYEYPVEGGQIDVAYVIPPGQLASVAPRVRKLQVVLDISASDYAAGTVTVFGPGAALFTPTENPDGLRRGATASKRRVSGSKRARAAALPPDSFNCYDTYFCIYESRNFAGRRLQFHNMGYWQNLSAWAFNDQADSMRNRRDRDSWLAEHGSGGGDRHCYDSHSSDGRLSDEWPWQPAFEFGDDASSTYNSYGDTSC